MAIINGTSASETLNGTSSGDTIYGLAGNDTLNGLVGDDLLLPSSGSNTVDGGDGFDIADYYDAPGPLEIDMIFNTVRRINSPSEVDTLANIEVVRGGYFNDVLFASSSGNGARYLDGYPGNDQVNGGSLGDTLAGGTGDDTLTGNGGNDSIHGEDGTDRAVYSGSVSDYTITFNAGTQIFTIADKVANRDGTDTVQAVENFSFNGSVKSSAEVQALAISFTPSTGNDSLTGTSGSDFIDALAGNDTVNGLAGDDTLIGQAGNDSINGGDGFDVVNGGPGDDTLDGGAGTTDTVGYDEASTGVTVVLALGTATGGSGNDKLSNFERVVGSLFNDSITGSDGADVLSGNPGNDSLRGGLGDDIVQGMDGDDTLEGGSGNDSISGGAGLDRAVFKSTLASYSIAFNDSTKAFILTDKNQAADGTDTITEVETFVFADATKSNAEMTLLIGQNTGPSTTPTSGNDSLTGTAGDDNINGLAGNDTINGLDGIDFLTGGEGNDQLNGGNGGDVLIPGSGSDAVNGGEGYDIVDYSDSPTALNIDLRTGVVVKPSGSDSLSSIEVLRGGSLDDVIRAADTDAGTRYLDGYPGNDQVIGGVLADTLVGNTGNDTLTGNGGNDYIDGNDGTDLVVFTGAVDGYTISFDATSQRLTITDKTAGRDGSDTVGSVESFSFGGALKTTDEMIALSKAVPNTPTSGNDTLTGTASADTVDGLAGNDLIEGLGGNDSLLGAAGADSLNGGDGNDTLIGGNDSDFLNGGDGIDTAVFANARANYTVQVGLGTRLVVSSTADGTDTLSGNTVERLRFSDGGLALDVGAGGSATNAVLVVGALLGKAQLGNAGLMGVAFNYFDSKASLQAACDALVADGTVTGIVGSNSTQALVSLLFQNIVGAQPQAAIDQITASVGSGPGQMSTSQLLAAAAGLDLTQSLVNLTGLSATGVVFA